MADHDTVTQISTSQNYSTSESSDAPSSPIKERSQSLYHALQNRPDPKELLDRNILHAPPSVPPNVQQKQQELEKALTASSLKRHLERRPEREELVNRNILHASTADAGIQAHQRELERSMTQDKLREKLKSRPTPVEVVEKGILSPNEDLTEE